MDITTGDAHSGYGSAYLNGLQGTANSIYNYNSDAAVAPATLPSSTGVLFDFFHGAASTNNASFVPILRLAMPKTRSFARAQ